MRPYAATAATLEAFIDGLIQQDRRTIRSPTFSVEYRTENRFRSPGPSNVQQRETERWTSAKKKSSNRLSISRRTRSNSHLACVEAGFSVFTDTLLLASAMTDLPVGWQPAQNAPLIQVDLHRNPVKDRSVNLSKGHCRIAVPQIRGFRPDGVALFCKPAIYRTFESQWLARLLQTKAK